MKIFDSKLTFRLLLLLAGILNLTSVFGQLNSNVRITKADIRNLDNKVMVTYTLNGSPNDRYYVWVELFNSKNEKLLTKTLNGDINIVKGTGEKMMSWDYIQDGNIIDDNIYALVSAKYIPPTSTAKGLLQSTVFPGWGNYQYRSGRPYWVKGVLGYGMLGSSAFMYLQSNQSYNTYKNSTLPSYEEPAFKDYKQQRQISYVFAGVSLAFWAWDYISVISKSSKHKNLKMTTVVADPEYKLFTATTPKVLINSRGVPPNLYAELSFSDDNNNGLIEAREKAVLTITLANQGKGDALDLKISVRDSINDSSMRIVNASQIKNVLKSGESVTITVPISTDIDLKTAKHKLTINVNEHYGFDMDPAYLVLEALAYQPPKLVFSGLAIIDSGIGTSGITEDGQLQPGEQVKAKLIIQNIGKDIAKGTTYSIKTSDPLNIFLDNTKGSLGDLKPGDFKEIYVTVTPNKRVTSKEKLPIYLTLTEDVGRGSLSDFQLPILLNQKPPQPNILNVKPDRESLQKNIARFEYTSNKFRTNIDNVTNIKAVAPSITKRAKSVGVIFGIRDYKELPPAPYADNDAKVIKEYFEKVLGVEQVISYTNDKVSGFIFEDVFNSEVGELQKAVVKGETEVFVFYSGHGIPDKAGTNVYLFPSDGKISMLESRGYNIEKLYQNLLQLGAKHVTVILDACFSGGSRQSESVKTENLIAQKGVRVKPKNSWLFDPNFTIISSSSGEETSLGFDASETGLFTYYLCAGLQGKADANGDKSITTGELKAYVMKNVMETSKKISGIQTPMFSGDENIVLTSY